MNNSIFLIRHAQSANNALPESQRVSDPGLTELGHRQAELLAGGVARFAFSQLFCSPFRRSLDTARPVAKELKLLPRIHADIYEQGGCYSGYQPGQIRGAPGLNRGQLEAGYPGWEICATIGPLGWNHGRDYETEGQVQQRAARVAQEITQQWVPEFPGARAAFVIHADFKRILLGALLETERWPEDQQPIYNTAISHLERAGDRWQLLEWNCVDHLTASLLSD